MNAAFDLPAHRSAQVIRGTQKKEEKVFPGIWYAMRLPSPSHWNKQRIRAILHPIWH